MSGARPTRFCLVVWVLIPRSDAGHEYTLPSCSLQGWVRRDALRECLSLGSRSKHAGAHAAIRLLRYAFVVRPPRSFDSANSQERSNLQSGSRIQVVVK